MKNMFKVLVLGAVTAIGMKAGCKVWNEVLEDKVDELKDRLAVKKTKKGGES